MPDRPPTHKPARAALGDGRPSASARGYGSHWRKLRLVILAARPVCEDCGRESAAHVDHVVSLERGGTNDEGNLRALCHRCHTIKTNAVDGGLGRKREQRG